MQSRLWIYGLTASLVLAASFVPAGAKDPENPEGWAEYTFPSAESGSKSSAVSNGDFEDYDNPLTGWTVAGSVSLGEDSLTNHYALFEEPSIGARSTLSQSISITSATPYLTFRYRVATSTGMRTAYLPPDSFTVSLIDASGTRIFSRPDTHPLWYSQGFFYADSDTNILDLDTYVTYEEGFDVQGAKTVTVNVSSLAGQTLTLEFCMAVTDNGVKSLTILDDVSLGCMVGYCCDSSGNVLGELDDGLPCTEDSCGSTQVNHVSIACCGDCVSESHPADIYFMMDATGSTSSTDWQGMKVWIGAALQHYAQFSPRPRIAIGCFGYCFAGSGHTGSGADGTYTAIDFTDDYDSIQETLQYMERPCYAYTSIRDALALPDIEFQSVRDEYEQYPDIHPSQYLILLTDGWANLDEEYDYCSCFCTASLDAAAAMAVDLHADGVDVFVTHYASTTGCSDTSDWLRENIASSDSHFFGLNGGVDGSSLYCEFFKIAELINCDDNDPSTQDCCEGGTCYHGDSYCND